MFNRVYNLPEIDFIGGESERLYFNLYTPKKQPFPNLDACYLTFSIMHYANRDYTSDPIFKINSEDNAAQIYADLGDEEEYNRFVVKLMPDDTFDLSGKYIYQIGIKDDDGHVEIPGQGIIMIIKNIDASFLSD